MFRWRAGTTVFQRLLKTATYYDGYVNNSDKGDFFAIYTYGFYTTFGGIERSDIIGIEFTNYGEICSINARENDSSYASFESVEIDTKKLDEAINSAFKNSGVEFIGNITDKELKVIPYKDELFVIAEIGYRPSSSADPSVRAGVQYIVKVAELK